MEVSFMLVIILMIQSVATDQHNITLSKKNWEIELVLAHEDCNKFYKYFNGKPLEIVCPKGLYFNSKYLRCDWKRNVDCNGRKIPQSDDQSFDNDEITNNAESESEDLETEEIDADSENEIFNTDLEFFQNGCPVNFLIRWMLPHEENCNQFYTCFLSIKIKRQCPPFLHFNRKHQVCDWPRAAGCAL